jgi:hypothetical protein
MFFYTPITHLMSGWNAHKIWNVIIAFIVKKKGKAVPVHAMKAYGGEDI